MQNILAAVFGIESEGYQAITELRRMPVTDKYAVLQMVLVKREGTTLIGCDGFDAGVRMDGGAAIGGMIGSLMGILGGPLGVLLLGSYGALTGHLAGTIDAIDDAALLEMVASKLVDGEVALIALTEEKEEGVLDSFFSKFTVDVARFDAAAIAAEVDEAEELQIEEERQKLLALREAKKKEYEGKAEQRRKEIEADFDKFIETRQKAAEAGFDLHYGS